jgi:hypothetical protein
MSAEACYYVRAYAHDAHGTFARRFIYLAGAADADHWQAGLNLPLIDAQCALAVLDVFIPTLTHSRASICFHSARTLLNENFNGSIGSAVSYGLSIYGLKDGPYKQS